jgi:hypothetical protein
MNEIQWKINGWQIAIGVLALGVGVALYVLDRPPSQIYFVPKAWSLFKGTPSTFGAIGYHLPTFLHVFAFCLITSGVLACGRQGAAVICVLWMLVDMLFEIGQQQDIASEIVAYIPDWFKGVPFLENTADYFVQGRFDPADLLAILFGAIAAYLLMLVLEKNAR